MKKLLEKFNQAGRGYYGADNILYKHKENAFHEFEREPLIPHMLSTEGPALVVADFNHDSLDDVFIGSSQMGKSAIFLQQKSGKFHENGPARIWKRIPILKMSLPVWWILITMDFRTWSLPTAEMNFLETMNN